MVGLKDELLIFLIAASPVLELRGAIPFGIFLKVSIFKTFLLAIAGNLLPVGPLLIFLKPLSEKLYRFRFWRKFFESLFERTKKRASLVEKYEAIGLALFVAIPLPITGAWTGAVAATLFRIRFKYAFLAILVGVIFAGIIVTILSSLGYLAWKAT